MNKRTIFLDLDTGQRWRSCPIKALQMGLLYNACKRQATLFGGFLLAKQRWS